MKAKLIEYAYPSSTTATKNGYGKTGCWFVSLYASENETIKCKRLKYFANKQEAINYAESLPYPYNYMHKYFN
jgi:hypothetical protein